MARKGRLWLREKLSSATPTIDPSSQGPAQVSSPGVLSDTGPAGNVSQKSLAWMRRSFLRPNKNHPRSITTETIGTSVIAGAQEQRDQLQAIPTQSDQRTTRGEAMLPAEALTGTDLMTRTCEVPVGPLGGASAACGPDLASLGSGIDTTQQMLDLMKPIP